MKPKSAFAANVMAYRKRRGINRQQLADAVNDAGDHGWTEYSVIGIENDRREVNGYELNALAFALGTNRDALLPADSLASDAMGPYLVEAA